MVQLFKIHMPIVHKQFEEWIKGNGNHMQTLIEAQRRGHLGVEMHFVLSSWHVTTTRKQLPFASKSNK
jgi:hypothetical protein